MKNSIKFHSHFYPFVHFRLANFIFTFIHSFIRGDKFRNLKRKGK